MNIATAISDPSLIRLKPSAKVIAWFESVPVVSLFMSVLTVGQIRKGMGRVEDKKRQEKLRHWLEHELVDYFGSRLLLIDREVANRWGWLLAEVNRPLSVIDSLLGATALHHDLALVTRNEKDFNFPGLVVINPWK